MTRGKGVTIHRASCPNVTRMRATQPERLISADWGAPRDEVFPVDIVVEAMDRQGLLRDISEVLSREKINVTAANTLTRNMQSRMAFTVEVQSLAVLKRALALVTDVPGVTGRNAALAGAILRLPCCPSARRSGGHWQWLPRSVLLSCAAPDARGEQRLDDPGAETIPTRRDCSPTHGHVDHTTSPERCHSSSFRGPRLCASPSP